MRNLKKVIALVAVFAMMVSTVAFAQTFSDVDVENNYYEAIEMLSNLDILTGDDADGDGTMDFRPEDKITRAEVATIISRIQGINNAAQVATDFVDVPATHWASGYVAQAAGQGIVNGYGDGNFGPEDNVLYEQAIKMLMVTIGYEPFAAANGGYPTGYLTAAQRFGVTGGVVGAATGAEATRGQIAQLVYNAIDTPMMDSATWGANAEYAIYDDAADGDYPFKTLLSSYLGVKKFSGFVTANQVTALDAYKAIDTDEEAEVVILSDDSDTNENYLFEEISNDEDEATLYAGESGIDALLGMHVTGYAYEDGNDYIVLAAAATAKNKTLTIGIDQFESLADGELNYWKNESDRTVTTVNVYASAPVLLNGVAAADASALFTELASDDSWSGAITLVENNSKNKGYDGISVEVATPVVVDEVSANGKVTLKASAKSIDNKKISLVFDEENNEQIIILTKNGAVIDYTELVEWDVISVLANSQNDFIVAEVIDAGKVEGRVSSVADEKYTIDGKAYEIANYAYDCDDLEPGSEGVFYIDAYGKIVAYSETGSTVASDKYAFIIKAKQVSDGWDGTSIKVELLDKSGEVYQAYLADKVEINNPTTAMKEATGLAESGKVDADDIDAAKFAAAVKNAFVTYEANSAGELKSITFAQGDPDVNELYATASGSIDYDAEDAYIKIGTKKYDVDENTLVFYMLNADDGDVATNGAIANDSKVDTIASLNTGVYTYGEIYDAQDSVAVLVLYNTKGGIDNNSNIALIDSVGQAVVGDEIVQSVTFFKDGEKLTATVDPDFDNDFVAGEVYRLAMSADGTTITDGTKVGTITLARTEATDESGAVAYSGTSAAFGPVVDYISSKDQIRFAPDADDLGTYETIKAADANVYVIDPVRTTNKITVGDASDVDFDDELINRDVDTEMVNFTKDVYDVAVGEGAFGMLDYVIAFENADEDVTDVIIFKAYDFGNKWSVEVPEAE